ncbi:hypothetical protein BG011_004005 [Mortierella polycephala]|uniref:O-methyltransferase n=1 Tax=Mortierella polycephala TaxID=41804 RepID=A0A9P6U3A8_9FUNG|nr:hypothetical protein BG011_004005 [Mortierella polycephala]
MAMADGMSDGGTVYTCEKDVKAAQLARDTILERHGLCEEGRESVKIDLWEDSAMKSLETMAKNGLQFDAIFIDADKGNYINYFDFILANDLLSKSGYILADNVLFRGMVLDSNKEHSDHNMSFLPPSPPSSPPLSPQSNDSSSKDRRMKRSQMSLQKTADHMDAFNRHIKNDQRVEVVVLPIFDGISIIVKK